MNAMPKPELRRHARQEILSAVMVTPDGHPNGGAMAMALDLSRGGARVGLLDECRLPAGVPLKVSFLFDTDHPLVLHGHVTRSAEDHLGVRFDGAQDEQIQDLLELFEDL